MVDEPDNNELASTEKLLIDDASNFQFHAAYIAYSDTYDRTTNPETKKQLNQNILALQQNQIDYPTFYRNIGQYREEGSSQYRYSRTLIRTQKKQEWRRQTQKREREKRHRK